jgi:hypothetical protein
MFQPANNNKSVAVSKVMGTSALGLQGKSMVRSGTKKVEGHDFAKTTNSNFETAVQSLKNKPNQKVLED